jgi:hypothetical protein
MSNADTPGASQADTSVIASAETAETTDATLVADQAGEPAGDMMTMSEGADAWHAGLLAGDQAMPGADPGLVDAQMYDGHVALALDPGALSEIDVTLDFLTSAQNLFDVPAMDLPDMMDDAMPT